MTDYLTDYLTDQPAPSTGVTNSRTLNNHGSPAAGGLRDFGTQLSSSDVSVDTPPFRALRIGLLGYRSQPFSGGQGVYLHYLSRALVDLGHHVDVISGEPYPDLDHRVGLVKLPGLNLYASDTPTGDISRVRTLTDFLEWASKLSGGFPEPFTFGQRLRKQWPALAASFDVIHDNQCLSWGTLALQNHGLPLVTTIHHPITWDRDIALAHATSRGERLLIRRWYHFLAMQTRVAQRLEHLVTVSESSRKDIAAAFSLRAERIQVIANGIDTQVFRPRDNCNPNGNPNSRRNSNQLISTASADQPLKGTTHLIRAFAQLRTRFPDLKLTFVGRPKPGGPTAQLIEQLNVGSHINFCHGISTDELCRLYNQAAVAVIPSEYEGFGLPAGEAMACGTPVVTTNGGALPEVVGDHGIVVPVRNPAALAEAVGQLLLDPARREQLSISGRAHIIEHFSWQQAAATLTRVYERAIATRTTRTILKAPEPGAHTEQPSESA